MDKYTVIKTQDGSYSLNNNELNEDYHSTLGAKTEAEKLYIEGSGYNDELNNSSKIDNINVLDIGLGLGYNAFSTIDCWERSKGHRSLNLVSLENDAYLLESIKSKKTNWKQNWNDKWKNYGENLIQDKDNIYKKTFVHPLSKNLCTWSIFFGDALDSIERLEKRNVIWNFIWQDPFSPKKNPSLWSSQWFKALGTQANEKTVLMTYSVARATREALQESSWEIEKIPTPGHKKSWLKAKPIELKPHKPCF